MSIDTGAVGAGIMAVLLKIETEWSILMPTKGCEGVIIEMVDAKDSDLESEEEQIKAWQF
jgi:hypothetical protein